jgi:hypothetical protein
MSSRGDRTQRRAAERRALNELRRASLSLQRSFHVKRKKAKIKNDAETAHGQDAQQDSRCVGEPETAGR